MARPEDLLVGTVALALVPLIAIRIRRGLRDGRLPVYRTYLSREERPGTFRALLVVHGLSLVVIAIVAADLLFNLGLRSAL
jgi:hypothetical protein